MMEFDSSAVEWLSANDSVYIKEVGQAIAGDVVKEECYRVLTVFTNICCDCDWDVIVKGLRPNVADKNAATRIRVFPVEVEKRQ